MQGTLNKLIMGNTATWTCKGSKINRTDHYALTIIIQAHLLSAPRRHGITWHDVRVQLPSLQQRLDKMADRNIAQGIRDEDLWRLIRRFDKVYRLTMHCYRD